jgi:hypothetical protein
MTGKEFPNKMELLIGQGNMFDTGGSLLQPIHHQQRHKSGFLNHSILAVRFCGGLIESS